ncbi:FG-GAP repeat domain-containing protein [Streptomyces virginiae]|uniref:FG-GAP repeat domain-containing protein n=1 Tax=Streptomyces virginiae TaxID=1961 RepID=UPI0036624731
MALTTAASTRRRARTRTLAHLGTLALVFGLATATPAAAVPAVPDGSLATPNMITRMDTTGMGLKWDGADAARADRYESTHPTMARISLPTLLAGAVTTPARPLCHDTNMPAAQGFCWSQEDDTSGDWIPQGITHGAVDQRKVVVTSWYGPGGAERLTFADVTDPSHVRYRHVQLTGLSPDAGAAVPLTQGHANAVVWSANRLYVAGIGSGLDVFDTDRIWQTSPDTYVLPRVGSYAYTGAGTGCGTYAGVPQRPCITSASLDLTGTQPALVTAEMDPHHTGDEFDRASAPVVRWPIDPKTGVLNADSAGRVGAAEAFASPLGGTQGIAMHNGRFALSAPCPEFVEGGTQHQPSCLYHGTLNEPLWLMTRTGIYNENLSYDDATDELWMLNERTGARTVLHTPWPTPPATAGMTRTVAADFTGDGRADVVAVESETGKLWLYPGTGSARLGARVQIGSGWNAMSRLVAGDFTGDRKADLVAVENATGTLQLYPGTGTANAMGTLGARTQIGSGWAGMRDLTAMDVTGDTRPDLLAIDPDGALWAYPGSGNGLAPRTRIGSGWNAMYELAAPGDLTADGTADLVAVDRDGRLWTYPGTGALTGATTLRARVQSGSGWHIMRDLVGADLNGDGKGDLIAVQAPASRTGSLYSYPGTGNASFGSRTELGTNW